MDPLTALAVVVAFGAGTLTGCRICKRGKLTKEELEELAAEVLLVIAGLASEAKNPKEDKPCEAC